jgi:hypothetical protein
LTHSGPARALLNALAAFYGGAGRSGDAGAGRMLDGICEALGRATPAEPLPAPRPIVASALLLPALPETAPCAAVAQTAHLFRWRQNPNYTIAGMGEGFMASYGYVEFAGPKEALFHAEDIRVGLLLLGPGLHYPLHTHPAEEIYHPLTDGGLWRRGTEDWRRVPAGHAIHHAPMMPHETKAAEDTLLALYCWRGDTTTEARLIA